MASRWTLNFLSSSGTLAALCAADCATIAFHSTGDFGCMLQVDDNGTAINACIAGLTSVGTGRDLAGTSRPASSSAVAIWVIAHTPSASIAANFSFIVVSTRASTEYISTR